MSIKSLLQIILILLIFIIIGGIYFIYFYPDPNKKVGLSEINGNINLSVDKPILEDSQASDEMTFRQVKSRTQKK